MRLGNALRDPWVWGQTVLIAVVLLGTGPLARRLPGHAGAWAPVAGTMLLALGILVGFRGAMDLGRSLTPATDPLPDSQLVTRGIYQLIRHPIYLGVTLALAAVPLLARNWLLSLVVGAVSLLFFEGKARTEERKLRVRHPRYREYAAQVPRLVPFGWR